MKAIKVQNFRSLQDTGHISLAPLTLLVGQNSSGKSSFLRLLPLLRQSIETRTLGPILWYGRYVDFGNFFDVLSRGAEKEEIVFSFTFNLPDLTVQENTNFRLGRLKTFPLLENYDICVDLHMVADKRKTRASKVVLSFAGNKIKVDYEPDGKVSSFYVNDMNVPDETNIAFSHIHNNSFIPSLLFDADQNDTYVNHLMYGSSPFFKLLFSKIRDFAHHKTSDYTIRQIIRSLCIGTSEAMRSHMIPIKSAGVTWRNRLMAMSATDKAFIKLQNMILAFSSVELLRLADDYISSFAQSIKYIGPVRATAERYYRIQDLAVDEIDFEGRNIAMFLHNLSEKDRKQFSDWTSHFFGFSPYVQTTSGHLSIRVKEHDRGTDFNLSDMGFGFSQILPILLQLWVLISRKATRRRSPIVFAIEQPELHLHPRMQAQLADAFMSAIEAAKSAGVDIIIMIENHSEVITNKIGQRISREFFSSSDVSVVVFDKDMHDPFTQVITSSYDNRGFLKNWPIGFFSAESA